MKGIVDWAILTIVLEPGPFQPCSRRRLVDGQIKSRKDDKTAGQEDNGSDFLRRCACGHYAGRSQPCRHGGTGTGVLATFVRVNVALLIGAAWTIPAGVAIGFSPRLSRIAQPLAQIAASVPATALFPIVLLILIRLGGGLGTASVVLLLLGTQWYILFNVIAGAIAIPADLKEAAAVFKFESGARWRKLILPGIFPYLITGLVTASGGAWNASIIAEYFHFKGQIFSTVGLGAVISRATDSGNFDLLIASTVVMAAVVVTINRLVWRKLYVLAETRYKLEY